VNAVEEVRAVFENIRKFLTYILAHNVPELIPYLAFALFKSAASVDACPTFGRRYGDRLAYRLNKFPLIRVSVYSMLTAYADRHAEPISFFLSSLPTASP
jgi:hypothetical protein